MPGNIRSGGRAGPESRALSEERLARLPAGKHGLPRDVVVSNQRERMIDAFAHVVVDKGYRATTVEDIARLAAVSRNVFYEQFGGKDECFIATYEVIRDHVRELMEEEVNRYAGYPERLVAALAVALRYFAAEPALARLCLLEPLSAGPAMSRHHEEVLGVFVKRLSELGGDREEDRAQTDEVLILGAISLVTRRINLGEAEQLEDLLPGLAQILLAPYMSEEEIREVVAKVEEDGSDKSKAAV
jgi:AcrR family transcriptional regulator